jgi:hypothetical protein
MSERDLSRTEAFQLHLVFQSLQAGVQSRVEICFADYDFEFAAEAG